MDERVTSALRNEILLRCLSEYRSRRQTELEDALRPKIATDESTIKEAVLYFSRSPGKRLRGLLTLLSCEVVGGRYQDAMEAACAVELIHASSLILDDLPCMDNGKTRRGQPCLHKRFGEAVAILTAIFFLNKAFQSTLHYKDFGMGMLANMTACIGENGMIEGQLRDILASSKDSATRALKTASLMKLAVKLGASAAGKVYQKAI